MMSVPGLSRRPFCRVRAVISALAGAALCLSVLAAAALAAVASGPAIRSVPPASAAIGTGGTTITGSGFTGATAVRFDGAAAVLGAGPPSKIIARVPATASSGPVTVTTARGGADSPSGFTVSPRVLLSPALGPPTSRVTVSGAGFAADEKVDVYFDTTDTAVAGTTGTGNFGPVTITIPAAAAPGTHWVSAWGRRSGLLAQRPFTVSTSWPQAGFSARRTGFNPYENVLNPDNVAALSLAWRFHASGAVRSPPAVVHGVVFASAGHPRNGTYVGDLYALNAATGARLWRVDDGAGVAPAAAHGIVYADCYYGFCARNAATGARLWRYGFDYGATDPALADSLVYYGSGGAFYAFTPATGALQWSGGGPTVGPPCCTLDPAVANGIAFFPFNDSESQSALYALNAATGGMLWSFPNIGVTNSPPAVANGVVYVTGADGHLYALRAATGARLWSSPAGGITSASLAVAHGIVYVSTGDGHLYALSAATGATLWSSPAGGGGAPAVANGVVYAGSPSHTIDALDAATGKKLWSYVTGGAVSSPVVANGMIYVGSADGNVYAFGLPRGTTAPARPSHGSLHPHHSLPGQH